jgi:four helix bundle protein
VQDYRRLRVWKKAHALVLNVRRATGRFPRNGYASLKSQITRAAESIPFNIVEGCGSSTQKEFARFLDIGIKSTSELEYQLRLATDYEIIGRSHGQALTAETVDIRRMLFGLRGKVLSSEQSESIADE